MGAKQKPYSGSTRKLKKKHKLRGEQLSLWNKKYKSAARRGGEDVTGLCGPSYRAVQESTAATVGPDDASSQVLTEAPCTSWELADDVTGLCGPGHRAVQKSTVATVGPDDAGSQVIPEAPCTSWELADDASPEPLPCNDLRNQENTVPPNTIEPLEGGWCRCCLVPISLKNEQLGHTSGELTDTYADMLLTTFGITVTPVKNLALICNECKICLQNAFTFKQQILDADKRLIENIDSGLFNVLDKNNESDVTNQSTIVEENNYGSDNMNPIDDDNNSENNYGSENMNPIDDHNNSDDEHDSAASKKVSKPQKKPGRKSQKGKNEVPGIKCDMCPKFEDNCVMMSYHVKKYHHRCLKCSKVFRNKYERVHHELTHPIPCELCKEELETDLLLRSHMVRVHKTTKFCTCPKCKSIFESRTKLNEHKVEAHGASRFNCGACDKVFYANSQLSMHHKTHHMLERNYSCTKCDYKGANSTRLRLHMASHSAVKSFKCQYCQKKFARYSTRQFHERIHTGDKRQVCQLCGAAFVQRASLKYHLEKQHQQF